jgi:hypothetical protein
MARRESWSTMGRGKRSQSLTFSRRHDRLLPATCTFYSENRIFMNSTCRAMWSGFDTLTAATTVSFANGALPLSDFVIPCNSLASLCRHACNPALSRKPSLVLGRKTTLCADKITVDLSGHAETATSPIRRGSSLPSCALGSTYGSM